MAKLTEIWADKLDAKRPRPKPDPTPYKVQWDHPDYPRGTKVTRKRFASLPEAKEYAIGIGLQYDLRKYNGIIPSLDPNLSRYKSGSVPIADEDTIPFVMPAIQTKGTMPLEISEGEIEEYKLRHGMPTVGKHIFKGDSN
tara:strand:+ start:12831 stop:13250 length:420 start_codon:yes stop_codon:yes gene_type:complete